MTIEQLTDNLRAATDQAGRWDVLKSFMADRASQPKDLTTLKMPTPGKRRASLTELRSHHLVTVEHIARRRHYDRASQHEFMLERWNRIFGGGLRPKQKEVPSDAWRKSWMLSSMLDLVEMRRAENPRRTEF
jgi:hypothetical protein